ncbi:hypothetical protein PV326_001947, partial [Microctonus aethiopoides]
KNIFEDKEFVLQHFGKYPTINVIFSGVNGKNFEQILDQLRTAIHGAFHKHTYLLECDLWNHKAFNITTFMKYFDSEKHKLITEEEIISGLVYLARILHAHFGRKVFVFIDEFDVPVNTMVYEGQMSFDDREKTIKVLRDFTRNLLKDNYDFVERSLSNACQQLGGIISNSANNVKVCAFLQDYSFTEFYGFREDEVISLLKIANKCDHFDIVKQRYDGYLTKSSKGKEINLYSPWAVIQYIESENYTDSWSAVSSSPGSLELRMPNTTVSDRIKRAWYDIYLDTKYPPEVDQKFIDALDGVAKSCNDASVRALAQSIEDLFKG